MSNTLLIVLILAAAAAVVFVLLRRKTGSTDSARGQTRGQQASPRENMLQILLSPGGACEAAQQLESHRFHKNNVPSLPLANCKNPRACHCRFQMVADRRSVERRLASTEKRESIRFEDKPRRGGRGRRAEDKLFDHNSK